MQNFLKVPKIIELISDQGHNLADDSLK